MFDILQNTIQPYIVEALVGVGLLVLGWFNRNKPAMERAEIEARHRDALHSALNTGVGLILDTIQKHPAIAAVDAPLGSVAERVKAALPADVIDKVIGYVHGSVPDALRELAPSEQQLELMARAKLNAAIDNLLGRDRLTEALKRAGVPDEAFKQAGL